MSTKPHAFRPASVELEPRALLSATPAQAWTRTLLTQSVQGRYQTGQDHRAADAPLAIKLTGTGTTDRATKLTGNLSLGGYRVANAPDVTGTILLTTRQGSLKLQLAGPGGAGFAPGSTLRINAGVVKGTGIYKDVEAVGPATLTFSKPAGKSPTAAGPVRVDLSLIEPVL